MTRGDGNKPPPTTPRVADTFAAPVDMPAHSAWNPDEPEPLTAEDLAAQANVGFALDLLEETPAAPAPVGEPEVAPEPEGELPAFSLDMAGEETTQHPWGENASPWLPLSPPPAGTAPPQAAPSPPPFASASPPVAHPPPDVSASLHVDLPRKGGGETRNTPALDVGHRQYPLAWAWADLGPAPVLGKNPRQGHGTTPQGLSAAEELLELAAVGKGPDGVVEMLMVFKDTAWAGITCKLRMEPGGLQAIFMVPDDHARRTVEPLAEDMLTRMRRRGMRVQGHRVEVAT